VVGLGPAGPEFLTEQVRAHLGSGTRVFLRTQRHPATAALSGYVAFDSIYESADTFADVYAAIVDALVEAATAQAPEPVIYAVPGSPLVAERTVELLRGDPRVALTIVPGLSFLDLAWERLGIDPLGAGVRLVDAEQFAEQFSGDRGPHLVAQCWSQTLLSEIKLFPFEDLVPTDVVLLSHLGLHDEQVVRVGWWDLDRTLQPDHLTSLYIPALPVPALTAPAAAAREVARMVDLVATLRAQCPWDRVQSHESLMPHLLEESYEVLDALRELAAAGDESTQEAGAGHLQEELGDLLFQVVFHARLAEEEGRFTLADVARGVHDKLVHRHPHIFGGVEASTAQEVGANWEQIKREEKGRSSVTEGIPSDLPSLLLSTKLQRKALSIGMSATDLTTGIAALADLSGRLADPAGPADSTGLADPAGPADDGTAGGDRAAARLVGDVLFDIAGLARRLGVDPELALRSRALEFRDEIVVREEGQPLPVPPGHTH